MGKAQSKRTDNVLSYVLLVVVMLLHLCAGVIAFNFLAYFAVTADGSFNSAWAIILWVSGLLIFAFFWFILSQALLFSWRITKIFLIVNCLILGPVVGKYMYIAYSAQG